MEIYADVVFLVNFVMDVFILWSLGILTGRKRKKSKIFTAGFVMSVLYCLLVFLIELRSYLNIFASVSIILIGVAIAYTPANVKELTKLTVLCHIIAFSIGGFGLAIYYFSNIYDFFGNVISGTVTNFSFITLIFSTAAFYIVLKLFQRWILRRASLKQIYYPIKIFCGTQEASLNVLADTGNTLCDPISNAPVIVAEYKAIKGFFPESIKEMFTENNECDLYRLSAAVEGGDFWGKFRMIPFSAIGRQNGLLLGFRPDRVEITQDDTKITLDNTVIGIYNLCLTKDGAYQGLINPQLLSFHKKG